MLFRKLATCVGLLFVLQTIGSAQDYKPFYMDNSEWIMERVLPGMGGRNTYEYWKVYTIHDTLINDKSYRIIATKNLCELRSDNQGGYVFNPSINTGHYLLGGIREEDKKIYFFRFDERPQWRIMQYRMNGFEVNLEHLLYDFDISPGDTTHYSDQSFFTVTNGDTSFFTVNYFSIFQKAENPVQGHNRYTMANSCAYAFPFEENYTFEGIGSSYGIFGAYDCFLTYLICFKLDDSPLIFNGQCDPCEGFSQTEEFDEVVGLEIFPNPARNNLSITFQNNDEIREVALFNNIGQPLRKYQKSGYSIQFDISDLPRGMIFLKISLSNDRQIIRKVILE